MPAHYSASRRLTARGLGARAWTRIRLMPLSRRGKVVSGALVSASRAGRETAGPSTALRSGRDDNSFTQLAAALRWGRKSLIAQMNCHPDRSAAQWRDLRFLLIR